MSETLDLTADYRASPEAMESRLGEQTVVLHLGSGRYFGLDPVATIVWERLKDGGTPTEIFAHVRQHFPDAPPSVEADVTRFLEQLVGNDLILRR